MRGDNRNGKKLERLKRWDLRTIWIMGAGWGLRRGEDGPDS